MLPGFLQDLFVQEQGVFDKEFALDCYLEFQVPDLLVLGQDLVDEKVDRGVQRVQAVPADD